MDKKIYTIVVTYNGLQWIDKCISSLIQSTLQSEIIVIDNLSTDTTYELIKSNFPSVRLIQSGANLGFGKANNIGMKIALEENADYVFLLNQDAWVESNTIKVLAEIHVNNREYGILSPVHKNGQGSALETKFEEYASPDNTPELLSNLFLNQLADVYSTKFVNAAAWLISKKCLEKVGGFNPIFPHYGEDINYIDRCQYHEFKTGIVPSVFIFHDSIFDWSKIESNVMRHVIFNLEGLCNINQPFRSTWLQHIKRTFDRLTSQLLFRKFMGLSMTLKSFFYTIPFYRQVKITRKLSMQKQAFLK